MTRNAALQRLDPLVGAWTVTISEAWFLEPADTTVRGRATVEWLGDAFLVLRTSLDGHLGWEYVIGHHDARDAYVLLYHDERGVGRLFAMTYGDDGSWTLSREDPDFHQRFVGRATAERMEGSWEASDDGGETWRMDLYVTFERP